jgi:glycosyltransferase involved in cell wall biosynthesis
MNILLVAYYFPPINSAGSQRPVQIARWLRRYGHTVSVLTHGHDQGTGTSPEIIRIHDPAYVRAHRGTRFWRWLFWRGLAEMQNSLGRYASIFSPWQREVLARAKEIHRVFRPDLIIATYPPLEGLEIGLELSQLWQIPLISDFRDGLLFQPIEEKRLRSHRCVRERYAKTEATVAAASTRITAVTPVLQIYFHKAYPGCQCKTIFNGYDPQEWLDLPVFSLPSGFLHIVHTGRFALSDSATDIRPFLAALRQAGRNAHLPIFRLDLVGEYSRHERSLLKDLLDSGQAVIHPLAERQQTLAYQKAADLLLLITRPGVRSGIPLKLFEYMFSGKPVLVLTDDMEIRRIVEGSGCGWCVSPLDELAITRLFTHILIDPAFQTSMERRPAVIEGFSWERQMGELNRLLTSLPPGSCKP